MKIWFEFNTALRNTWSFCKRDNNGYVTKLDTGIDCRRGLQYRVINDVVAVIAHPKTLQTFLAVGITDTIDDEALAGAYEEQTSFKSAEHGEDPAVKTDPNDTQVGGDHYKGVEFQPWDWPRYGLGYYEVSAIAYLARFRKKGGLEDLGKVQHYIDKMLHEYSRGEYTNNCQASLLNIRKFNLQNECDRFQSEAVQFLVTWRHEDELLEAKKIVEELYQTEKDDDFNHHHEQPVTVVVPPMKLDLSDFVLGSEGTGAVQPAPAPPSIILTPDAPYVPLKSALKVPKDWDTDPGILTPE